MEPMKRVNVHEAKTNLSALLASGEPVLICRHNVPVAELRPLAKGKRRTEPRPVGLYKGKVDLTNAFTPETEAEIAQLFEDAL
jgi:antitoxin (DNA-binding transcriptional repressor) of toxin-antitoxin stability system